MRVWDLATGRCTGVVEAHERAVLCLAVHGSRVFSGGYDSVVRAWEMPRMSMVAEMRGHSDAVRKEGKGRREGEMRGHSDAASKEGKGRSREGNEKREGEWKREGARCGDREQRQA